jgi:formamidopyrimidine-DNA glycosylase
VPELPEVERAVVELRRFIVGRRIASLDVHHPSLRRRISPAQRRSVRGARVTGVRRRGKHQLIDLDDGRVLHAHFRMSGDWAIGPDADGAAYPRATVVFEDGSRVVLNDPRALSSIVLVPAGHDPVGGLGPDADDSSLTAEWLREGFATRRGPVKVILLDQSVISGIGNIYASESLWRARVDPRRAANELTAVEVRRLLRAIQSVLKKASGARYDGDGRFEVYDREGKGCRRCGSSIHRIVQAGRSTYLCPGCQGGSARGRRR